LEHSQFGHLLENDSSRQWDPQPNPTASIEPGLPETLGPEESIESTAESLVAATSSEIWSLDRQ
jgi:hypothetical protein